MFHDPTQVPEELANLTIDALGTAEVPTPYAVEEQGYVSDRSKVLVWAGIRDVDNMLDVRDLPMFERAGPRKRLFFEPAGLTAGIVTCGGLCPGLNDVIRSVTLTLLWQYGVPRVLGFRLGYEGLSSQARLAPMELTPASLDSIQHHGGTVLGTSRGPQDPADMVDTLVRHGVGALFVIGGDGTFAGAHAIAREVQRRKLPIAIVGIPKTIDNDICWTEMTFGFNTSVEEAQRALSAAHTEARAAWNGVGMVKLMGRDSGFITAGATLANSDVNFCLVPEVSVPLEGPDGLLARLERRLEAKHHAVIALAEGAGAEWMGHTGGARRDASGNRIRTDVGLFLKDRIVAHFKERGIPLSLKYIDPSYMIRGCPANARDSLFCLLWGQYAVHAAMAGKTDMFVGYWNQHFTHVPLEAAIGRRKKLDVHDAFWHTIEKTVR